MGENYNYFMKADVSPYIGEWIAIAGEKIVAHGKNAKKVFEEAKRISPKKRPLIARVPGKETMIL